MLCFAATGELIALGAAVCWTLCTLAFTHAGRAVGSLSVNLIRLLIAGVLFALLGLLVAGQPLPLEASPRAWWLLGVSGAVGFFLGDLFLFKSFLIIGPRQTLLIMSLWPPVAALIAWPMLGETLSVGQISGIAVTLSGVVWVLLERPGEKQLSTLTHQPFGVFLAAAGAVGQAVGYVLSKMGMNAFGTQTEGPLEEAMLAFQASQIRLLAAATGFAMLFSLLRRWGKFAASLRHRRAMTLISLGAITGPFLGVGLSLLALLYTSAGVASTMLATTPVLILPFVIVIDKERVSLRAVLGALVAFAGVAMLLLL